MKSFQKFEFIKESGSHSEIGILGCDIWLPWQEGDDGDPKSS
jgi:hypothetical protein